MQRLSNWARWIAAGFFTLIVIPLLVEFLKHLAENIGLYDRPREAAGAFLNFFLSLAGLPWLRVTALVLGGFVAGLWVDWLLRKLDRSRNAAREKIGSEMQELANKLESASASAQGFPPYYPELMSLLLKVLKHGIWTPVESIHRAEYRPAIWVYLTLVGTLLRDGHFDMARQAAWVLKNTFERASAEQK